MPATESTWRNMTTMHRIFAVSGVVLTLATIWMFYKDHVRPWKEYQRQGVDNDVYMTRLREAQFETEQAEAELARLTAEERKSRELPIPAEQIEAFRAQLKTQEEDFPDQSAAYEEIKEAKAEDVPRLWAKFRARIVPQMQKRVNDAKIRETQKLQERKFQSANLDKAKADYDIGIRDNLQDKLPELQGIVNREKAKVDALTAQYQTLSDHRRKLEAIVTEINAPVAAANKAVADSQAALKRLQTTIREKRENYVEWYGYVPGPGKEILNLPILDAFMGRRKPDNLWSEGLMQDYANFAKVRRFDRCTTCHTAMQKSQPGEPTTPLYAPEHSFEVVITPRTPDELKANRQALQTPEVDAAGQPIPYTLSELLGLQLADHGLLNLDDVIVKYVQPKSPVAAALPIDSEAPKQFPTAEEILAQRATGITPVTNEDVPSRPGLLVGDVIEAIDGSDLFGQNRGPQRATVTLIDLATEGKPFQVRVRRGLPHPYSSHPRLDLFVSDASPHKMSTFACTICHEGQGSATEFKWASHTPNDPTVAREWALEYGWFNNHHWIYPMLPERFTQATCLKCHHDVVELEPSEKFPDPPAEKLMHGYHLIRKYGCYGCHEVNGYDGPTKRIGPDLRLEPNFFAVAQQLEWEGKQRSEQLENVTAEADADKEALAGAKSRLAQMMGLAKTLAANPEDNASRRQLMVMIEEDQAASATSSPQQGAVPTSALTPQSHRLAVMLRDVDAPGSLRKPGPSLRFVKEKVDDAFLYDWIWNPQHFRPTTRMPKFFTLWDHLKEEPESLKHAQDLEPIEVRGLVAYLNDRSQNFEPIPRPEGVDEWTDEQMIARGKQQFEMRGCLACHTHNDFPDTKKFRTKDDIVQGPDLSNIGAKFSLAVNKKGPQWLYSWIKEPTRYHPRTVMPNVFLEPLKVNEVVKDAEGNPVKDENGMDKTVEKVFDPAEDITTYLLSDSHGEWTPVKSQQELAAPLGEEEKKALRDLTLEYLNEAFFEDAAKKYYDTGLTESMRAELKGAETELITPDGKLSDAQRLRYIGLKTVSKYGCYGCHDIPGFEDAKPIGTQLQNWGRKDPSRLAFEHIGHYGHGHKGPTSAVKNGSKPGSAIGDTRNTDNTRKSGLDREGGGSPPDAHVGTQPTDSHHEAPAGFEDYYQDQLHGGSRIGFAYQKLKEPRSYDYQKTANKRYNERLRMPQFPFNAADREAVITFVVGLVAEPPREKYLYRANPRAKAIAEGKIVLEKFNCAGCHILEADKFKISYTPGQFGPQSIAGPIYPFLQAHVPQAELAKAAIPDSSNRLQSLLAGLPALTKGQGVPELVDADDGELTMEDRYDPKTVKQSIELIQPAIVDGNVYHPGQAKFPVPGNTITGAYTGHGGMLTRYLLPRVTRLEQEVNPNADGAQAYGWLPPPLFGEGSKVQNNWLFEFLLEPYPIRPAVFLRMPKFNMSRDEATKLVNYFAAVDNANYPYEATPLRQNSHLAEMQAAYEQQANRQTNRLDDALKIVINKDFCVKCHIVGDFDPGGSARAKAPNLADVHRRMRPEYLRQWIGNPKMILPYTAMPVNIPYEPASPQGKASPELFVGNSEQQVQGLVDLLMNFDQYAKEKNQITPLVPPTPPTPPEGTTPAPATGANN
jgi:cytochrome c2